MPSTCTHALLHYGCFTALDVLNKARQDFRTAIFRSSSKGKPPDKPLSDTTIEQQGEHRAQICCVTFTYNMVRVSGRQLTSDDVVNVRADLRLGIREPVERIIDLRCSGSFYEVQGYETRPAALRSEERARRHILYIYMMSENKHPRLEHSDIPYHLMPTITHPPRSSRQALTQCNSNSSLVYVSNILLF